MTVAEEREAEARILAGKATSHVLLTITFFVLTVIAGGAMYMVFRGVLTGIICVGIAEALIRSRRTIGNGVESALWLGGLFSLISALPSDGSKEALLLFAAACALAGARVRNAIIGALAAILIISYLGARDWYVVALLAGIATSIVALSGLAREWQRPSTERLFIVLAIVAPITGAAWSIEHVSLAWSLAYIALALGAIVFGIRGRDRVAFIVSAIAFAIGAIMLRDIFTFPLELKLIASGASLFAISALVSRKLRDNKTGFVVTPLDNEYENALQVFGTIAVAPTATAAPHAQSIGGGGSFGGAGSTGSF